MPGARSTFMAFVMLVLGGSALADALPPLGKRTYVIDQSTPHAPVTIQDDKYKSEKFLKDPVLPTGELKIAAPRPKPPPPPKPQPPKARPGRMRFGALQIAGHLRQPRVEFGRDVLQVGRADQVSVPDVYQKVFEPARDRDF